MDLLVKDCEFSVNLVVGGFFIILAVVDLGKQRNIPGMVFWVLVGAAIMAPSVLFLMGHLAREWASVSDKAVIGFAMVLMSIAYLCSPPSRGFPVWAQWTLLVGGAGTVLWAVVLGLLDYCT